MQFAYFIGVDVSKATLDFAVAKANQIQFHQQVSNDQKGISLFIKELRKQTKACLKQCLFCMEHTATADRGNLQQSFTESTPPVSR